MKAIFLGAQDCAIAFGNQRIPAPYTEQQKRGFFEEITWAACKAGLKNPFFGDFNPPKEAMSKTGPLDSDPVRKSPEIERKRVWAHGDGGNENCSRKEKPVYTEPERAPGICRGYVCDNEEWYARGHVLRDKETKKVLVKEAPDGKRTKVD